VATLSSFAGRGVAVPPKQQSKRAASAAARGKNKASLSLDEDLDSLFAEALEATEKRAGGAAVEAPPDDDWDDDDYEDADQSIHILVDEDLFTPGELEAAKKADEPDHGPEFSLDELSFLGPDGDEASSKPDQKTSPDDPRPVTDRSLDDLARELRKALADEEEEDENDLQREMERLLASSFGLGSPSDDDDELSFPEIDEEEDDHEILAVGDDGAHVLGSETAVELERARSQVAELSRLLSMRDIELRTAEDRVETLESQLVATARQSANIGREFESFRRRSDREKEDLGKFAGEKVIKEFLGVYDNLERALGHAGEQRDSPLGQGVDMILGQFMGALKRCGVERVDATAGVPFDPTFHEAVGQEPHDEIETGAIIHEMQAGFVLSGRLVRAAMVSVSQGPLPAKKTKASEAKADEKTTRPPAKKKSKARSKSTTTKTKSTRSKAKKTTTPKVDETKTAEAKKPAAKKAATRKSSKKTTGSARKPATGSARKPAASRARSKKASKPKEDGKDG